MKLKSLLIGSLLMALATTSMAQVTLTQTTTSDFMKGTGQNVVIANDNVSLQSKMLAIDDYVASTNLPQTLMNHQLVTWQTYVFCVGGQNGSNPVNTVYRASQQSSGFSSWTTMNNLPVALTEMAVAATQTNLIVLGGKNDDGVSDKIYVAPLNLTTAELGNWSESPFVLPQPLRGARAIAVHDNIYVIGGANTDDEVSASDKVYCLKLNSLGNIASIEEVASLPEARNGHAVATYDSKIYVLGGQDAAGILKNTVWTSNVNLDGTLGVWQSQAVMPLALKNHAAVCANGILAFLGGMGNDLPSTQLYYADLSEASLNWTLSNVILSSRIHSGASCAFGNKIFYTGGQNLSGSVVNLVCYAPIVTGAAKVGKACFVSQPFDLGYPQKTIEQLAYTLVQTENTSYEVLYRLADSTLVFGNWISGGTSSPVTVGQTKHAIQYMFRLTATSTDDIQLQDVSVIMSGFTQLAGNLNSMSVLSAENSPYYVTSTISFTSGIHDIDPGVVIYFTEGTSLNITYACVRFNGTEESPILLTYGNDDNHHWNGMFITGSNSSNQGGVYSNTPSSLSYTIIEKAGVGDNTSNLCLTYANRPTFSHCISRNSAGRGIYLSNSSPTITDCSFEDNATSQMYLYSSSPTVSSTTMTGGNYGVYLSNSCSPTFTNCVSSGNIQGLYSYTPDRSFSYNESNLLLTDNTYDIRMAGGTISANRTWNYYANGYLVASDLTIQGSSNPTLTIAPGNTISVEEGKYIYVGSTNSSSSGGGIYAVGNETDSITFTAKASSWGGLYFRDASDYSSSSSLRYCIVEKGSTNIYCDRTTQPQLMYNTVRNPSGNSNISLNYSGINMDECHVYGGTNGVFMKNSSTATMVMSTFENLWACVRHGDNTCTSNFVTCTMRNSNQGIRYNTPDVTIPTYFNLVTFDNVTSSVSIAEGSVSSNRTWLKNEYGVLGNVSVYSNNRLTIEAGSTLRFTQGVGLGISAYREGNSWNGSSSNYKGELYAVGTEESPITFTSLNGESGGWTGIYYGNYSDYSGLTSRLKHCVIEKATTNIQLYNTNQPTIENCEIGQASERGVRLYCSGPSISDCEIHDNGTYGIYSESSSSSYQLAEISGCNFHDNGNYGLYFLYPISVGNVLNGLQFSNNGADGIGVGEGSVDVNRTWPSNEYHILGNLSVYSNNRLTVEAGSTLCFAQGVGLGISGYWSSNSWYDGSSYKGELYAEGTEESPITFTSLNGESGGWTGIYFGNYSDYSGLTSRLKHCVIEKATSNVYLYNTNQPTIENCQIRYASGTGLSLYSSSPVVQLSSIHHNGTRGIYLSNNSNPTIGGSPDNGCNIYNNGGYAVYQYGSNNINMPYNFWGEMDSKYIDDNLIYDKKDNSNNGRITFEPVSWFPIGGFGHVQGNFAYDGNANKPLAERSLELLDVNDSIIASTTTDANGVFNFANYAVDCFNTANTDTEIDVLQGVNATDALLVMRHYVHLDTLTGAHITVADVNGSGTVNGTDAMFIMRRAIDGEFPSGNFFFYNHNGLEVSDDTCHYNLNFLCYGDVNGSYTPQTRDNSIELLTEGQLLAGSYQELELPVSIKQAAEVGAITLNVSYSEEYLEIEDVLLGTTGESMVFAANGGKLTTVWFSLDPAVLAMNDDLIIIKVHTKDLSELDEPLTFNLSAYSELADSTSHVLEDVIIAMPEIITLTTTGVSDSTIGNVNLNVYPNPAKDVCRVSYQIPEAGRVTVSVYNMMGVKVMNVADLRQEGGRHEVNLNTASLAAGMYSCRITFEGENSWVKTTIIIIEK